MTSSIFELEQPATALCSLQKEVKEDHESHSFLVATNSCSGQNKTVILNFDEESNSIVNTVVWGHEEGVLHLSSSPSTEKCLYSAVYSNHSVIYTVSGESRKEICSFRSPCDQILWDPEGLQQHCISVSQNSISEVSLASDKLGMSTIKFESQDKILAACIDPFHSNTCLVSSEKGLRIVDFRLSGPAVEYMEHLPLHGFDSATGIDYSSVTPGRFITTGTDGTVKIYDLRVNRSGDRTFDTKLVVQAHDHAVHQALYNPFHDELFISCSSDQSLRLWELKNHFDGNPIQTISEFHDSVLRACWSGPWVFAGLSYSGKLVVDTVNHEKKMSILLEEEQ